jgi:predicted Rossmann fold flavoprotein
LSSALPSPPDVDIAIVGAGAAGLATALFLRRATHARSVVLFDGAKKPGAKILISGGGRCNITNARVTETDFSGGRRALIRQVLRAFTEHDTVALFRGLGVPLHEEAGGKLFPDSNQSRDVLAALMRGLEQAGATLRSGTRVLAIEPDGRRFTLVTSSGDVSCRNVVLATGGLSVPQTGSDGAGFTFAERLGHSIVPTTPALVPLLLDRQAASAIHRSVSGVSHEAELHVRVDGRVATRLPGSLLWTHFGVSGPVALDASRHYLRAQLDGHTASLSASLCPEYTFESLDRIFMQAAAAHPRSSLGTMLADRLPSSVAAAVLEALSIDASIELAHLPRAIRRTLTGALLDWPLPVAGARGYNYAEATAGGVRLDEVAMSSMESRVCPGLYLVGEVLDVDGRIGGFNFQWAWSTGFVAARALAAGSTTFG